MHILGSSLSEVPPYQLFRNPRIQQAMDCIFYTHIYFLTGLMKLPKIYDKSVPRVRKEALTCVGHAVTLSIYVFLFGPHNTHLR